MPDLNIISSFVELQSYEITQWKRHHKSWIELWLQPRRKIYRCFKCRKELTSYYNRRWAGLRDLNIATHMVYLWVPHYLVDCPRCGIGHVALAITRRYARCTHRFEHWLFQLTKDMTIKAVAELTQTDWRMIKEAEIRASGRSP